MQFVVLQTKSARRSSHRLHRNVDAGSPVAPCPQVEQLPREAEGPRPRVLARAWQPRFAAQLQALGSRERQVGRHHPQREQGRERHDEEDEGVAPDC